MQSSKIQFLNLNEDVQRLIFKGLGFRDLLSMSQTNQYLRALAGAEVKRKFSEKTILVYDPHANKAPNDFYCGGQNILIQNVNTLKNVLQRFGTLLPRLKLEYTYNPCSLFDVNMNAKDTDKLYRSVNAAINLYCAESLVDLQISSIYDNIFEEMEKPFTQVESVTLKGNFKKLSNSHLTFDELFPALRRLSLQYVEIHNKTLVEINFPNLEYLSAGIFDYDDPHRLTTTDMEKILRKNPQIRRLKLQRSNQYLLRIVSELLPNLEKLEIEDHNNNTPNEPQDENKISFENLKVLTLFSIFSKLPKNVSFEHLEELHTEVFPGCMSWGRNLLIKCSHLKKLYLEKGCVESEMLKTLIPVEAKLNEISFRFCGNVGVTDIIQFVRDNHQINKMNFEMFDIMNSLKSVTHALRKDFNHGWIITEGNYRISIERS